MGTARFKSPFVGLLAIGYCLLSAILIGVKYGHGATNGSNQIEIMQTLKEFDLCVVQATFSYHRLMPRSNPPKTIEELKAICRYQADGFKCLKKKTRGAPALLRRGLLTYVASRQKHYKKYCTEPGNEISKKFVEDLRCNMEKRIEQHERIDEEFALKLVEIARRNYTDSAMELKYLCCTFSSLTTLISNVFVNSKLKLHNSAIGTECAHTKATIEELSSTVVPSELNNICEDEEKLAKTCAALPPIVIAKDAKFSRKPGTSPPALALFLILTLGEPSTIDYGLW